MIRKIIRILKQRYGLFKNKFIKDIGSYPFISGDTFKQFCPLRIENIKSYKIVIAELRSGRFEPTTPVFMSVDFVVKYGESILSHKANINLDIFSTRYLVIHNGDKKINNNILNGLSLLFKKILVVNYDDSVDTKVICAIPIGLENKCYNNTKYLNYFHNNKISCRNDIKLKNNLIFSCFDINTNRYEREPLSRLIEEFKYPFYGKTLSRSKYLEYLASSFFCISPVGNGVDCHRTWEAIYLGCIPVLLKGTLSKELIRQLPILEVCDWRDVLQISKDDLMEQYKDIIKKSQQMAYFDYWSAQIKDAK